VLIAADILKWQRSKDTWIASFRDTFMAEYIAMAELGIEEAPASMLPLHDVPDWVQGEKNLNIPFISHTSKVILDKVPNSVLYCANKLQAVRYEINPFMLPFLKHRWKQLKEKATAASRAVRPIERTQLGMQINLLEQLSKEAKAVQFMITACYRGRFYMRGGLITPQGADFCKASFQYKKPEKLGKHGMSHLARHYANVAGIDKESIDTKEIWAYQQGCDLAIKVVTQGYFPKEADKPYQTLVAANEWYQLMQHIAKGKKPRKFKSKIVCHIDGSCNGLQHGAALLHCRQTANFVNCTRATTADKPQDAYFSASEKAIETLTEQGEHDLAAMLKRYGRKALKQAVIITVYGSTKQVAAVKKELTPTEQKTTNCTRERQVAFSQGVTTGTEYVAEPIITLNAILQSSVAGLMNAGPKAVFWKTSDGFPVMQAKRSGINMGHGLFTYVKTDIDPDGQVRAITANFIHSIDGDHLRAVVSAAPFDMTTVHDSFGCHAGHMQSLNTITRDQFVYIHKYDYIASLNKHSGMNIQLPEPGDYDPSEVRDAPYFFA
jgi:DNA-directed RNA polymerase